MKCCLWGTMYHYIVIGENIRNTHIANLMPNLIPYFSGADIILTFSN